MVWIAVAGAVAVIGVIVWSFRRNARGADDPGGRSGWDWESRLGEDARVAFMEGVRACQDQVGPLDVDEERGLLRIVDPPRIVSLFLLADRFTARGQEGLHDPQGVLRELVTQCVATEQPGVLHLRADWLSGEVDGMDRQGFTAAVRAVVCPDGASWAADESTGCLEVTLPGASGEYADTALLDLGRVVERYEKARAERPTGAPLRDVVAELVREAGPGLTWTRPPTERHRTTLLAG